MAPLFAIITCVAYAVDNFFVRQGLEKTPNPMIPTVITLSVNFLFFVILSCLFVPRDLLRIEWIYLFVIAGILAPGCGRVLSYKGIETLGLSINAPIVNAESLFAVLMAVIFLKEPVTLQILTGILTVVTGLVLLGYETGKGKGGYTGRKIRYRYLFYPIMASVVYGVSVFFRKLGLNEVRSPILGATFTSGTSWLIFTVTLMSRKNGREIFRMNRESFLYFFFGGVATCVGWYALFYALSIGRVSIVTPIATSYSLVTLLMSYFFLRRVEKITLTIVMATVLVVGGVVLLSVAK